MISRKTIEIRYNETDQMGIVYHANYLVWLELGRAKFLKDLGFDYLDLERRNLLFPIREVNVEYLKPCRYGEEIIVETWVSEFSAIKTVYDHVIMNNQGEIKAKAKTTLISVDKSSFRIVKLDKYAKDVYDAYNALIQSKETTDNYSI